MQFYAAISIGTALSPGALTSLCVSLLSTGFIGATISYDFDTSPEKRANQPEFYGYMSDNQTLRTMTFLSMVLNSALVLCIRAFSSALLFNVNTRHFVFAISVDMLIYFTQKGLRFDYRYWMFRIEGPIGAILNFFARLIVKLVTDYTSIVHFRHPYELGGFYWTFNMFLSLAGSWISVYVYKEQTENPVNDVEKFMLALTLAWFANFTIFLSMVKRRYLKTFYTIETGKQFGGRLFLEAENDTQRAQVFTRHSSHWKKIKPKVQDWLNSGWADWEAKGPLWFHSTFLASVPPEMVKLARDASSGLSRNSLSHVVGEPKEEIN